MGERVLDLRPCLNSDKLRQVAAALDALGPDDRLTLVLEREDSHETEPVMRMLHQRGLGWQPKGGHRELYTIHVSRQLPRPRGPDPDDPMGPA